MIKRRLLSILLVIVLCASMIVNVFAETVSAEEESEGNILITVTLAEASNDPETATEESTPYWTEETENEDGTTETVTHYVTDSEGNPVDIGAEPPELDAEDLEAGHMDAQKFGAFENEEDAENGIVKLTFDVVGKPVEVDAPIDMLIIGDESGSMNMYGRADTSGNNVAYMPCLNEEHYYGVEDLQKSLYESEQAKLKNAIGALDKALVEEMTGAMAEDAETSVEDILASKTAASDAAAAALAEAQAKYDEATEEERAALEEALNQAKSDSEAAAAALSAATNAADLLQKQAANSEKLNACEGGTTYINPHAVGLENIVFNQWNKEENWDALIDMVEAAGIDVPEHLNGSDVYKLLFKTADDTPDKNHYHYNEKTGSYEEIKYVENNKTIKETGAKYSYWSPSYDNEAGCVDRMMLEKLAAAGLATEVLKNDDSNVGYIGFTYSSYPSLCSGGFMDAKQLDDLLEVIQKTEGHDYTNYVHALWTAKHYIENRTDDGNPVYIVFMSDGVPTRKSSATANEWNILDAPVVGGPDGDCLGFNEIFYGETGYSQVDAAVKVADELKKWYKKAYGEEMELFTVGINTNDSANKMLGSMASDQDHFLYCEDPKTLATDILSLVPPNHVAPSGVLTDKIGEDFELLVDADHPFTVSGLEYDISAIEEVLNNAGSKLGDVVSFQVSVPEGATRVTIKDVVSITWEVNEVDENGDRISYYVQMKSEELEKFEPGTRIYDTNADTAEEAGANLVYYALSTNKEGDEVFVASDPTTVELRTPHVVITNVTTSPETEIIPSNPEQPSVEELPEEKVPLEELPEEDVPLTEIMEEDVPLANVPMTGDNSLFFIGMSVLSGSGLAGLALTRKKEDEE